MQVLTRLLWSSSPLLYWYCGAMYVQTSCKEKPKENQFMTPIKASSVHKSGQTRTSDIWLSKLSVHFITEVIDRWSVLCIRFRAVFIYCVIYFVVGTIMFSNFLPWTWHNVTWILGLLLTYVLEMSKLIKSFAFLNF